MKVKYNKFERVAGLFVLTAIVGAFAALIGVAVKRGWFETKLKLEASFATADGLHAGTVVQMAGLRAGSVESVELKSNNQVLVQMLVSRKFFDRVRDDSVVRVMRPFIIGEKVLDISVGGETANPVLEFAVLKTEEGTDVMELLNGRKIGPYIEMIGQIGDNLRVVAEAFMDPQRSKDIVKVLDEIRPLVSNMNGMSREVTSLLKSANKDQRMVKTLENLAVMSSELARVLPEFTRNSPELATDLTKIAKNTAILTEEMSKLVPMMSKMAPELPRASERALEALDETVVTLKAMQKSFLLKGNVKEVREEESKARVPAGESK